MNPPSPAERRRPVGRRSLSQRRLQALQVSPERRDRSERRAAARREAAPVPRGLERPCILGKSLVVRGGMSWEAGAAGGVAVVWGCCLSTQAAQPRTRRDQRH